MTDFEKQYREDIAGIKPPSIERAKSFETMASELREQGRHLGAAFCSLDGHWEAWGIEPQDLCPKLLLDTINDLQQYLGENTTADWNRLLAIQLLAQQNHRPFFRGNIALQIAKLRESAQVDYHALLYQLARDHPSADALLVSGFQLTGCLDGNWEPSFPGYEIIGGSKGWDSDGTITFGMNSGFRILLELADYDGAMRISQTHEQGLITPGLRGWSIASQALLNGDADGFADASAQFKLDTPDRVDRKERHWAGINQQLWAPYFMSRSHLARPCDSPILALDTLRIARNFDLKRVGWHVPHVNLYFQVIKVVLGMADGDVDAVNTTIKDYQRSLRWDLPSSFNSHVMSFFDYIKTLSSKKLGDNWFDQLTQLVAIIDRLPILTDIEKKNIKSTLNIAMPNSLNGLERGWIYNALNSINDERILHRILLALFRAEAKVPLYSHIRHGPFEYGKDIVVCREDEGRRILKMYSVKVGELKKTNWNKDVRPQLEEIFQVTLDSMELPENIDERIGVLAWNNHFSPHLETIVNGWHKQQFDAFGNKYEFMHIDRIVSYVETNGLGGALRTALRDEGLLS